MSRRKKIEYKVAAFDFETDPFKHGRVPVPFSWGFYNGERYVYYWGDDCEQKFIDYLDQLNEPHIIYAHNGGKFDFIFLMKYFSGEIKIVNGRILEVKYKQHLLRDSYAILPVPLSATEQKLDIDYSKMEPDVREQHKEEILEYLKADCYALHNLVTLFRNEFGDRLTIGGTAMNELKQFHPFDPVNEKFDEEMRPFYFGGRCQAFEKGIINTKVKVFDVNSMYPYAMRDYRHPFSTAYYTAYEITDDTYFIEWVGHNRGAVPVRTKTGLDFNVSYGVFYTSIHEYRAGIDTGTITVEKINRTINFIESTTFQTFVDHFFKSRATAKANGDLFHDLFYKLILNSAYGKFAQNPENYKEWCITPHGEYLEGYDGLGCDVQEHFDYTLWGKPAEMYNYFNVAVAASITGAARAQLLRALANTTRPLYCDTDSIICEDLTGVEIDPKKLGAWDLEAEGDKIAIAGKKLYALFNNGECIKLASKGVSLIPRDLPHAEGMNIGGEKIAMVADGGEYQFIADAPSFKLDGRSMFIHRKIRST